MSQRVRCTKVVADPDGSSRFDDTEVPLLAGTIPESAPAYLVSEEFTPSRMVFTSFPADFAMEWHPAPRRQYILVLSGSLDVSTSDGDQRVFLAGDVLFMADTTGRGHCTKTAGDEPCVFASVAVE